MKPPEDPSACQCPSTSIPYDPPGEVLTTDHLRVEPSMDDGRPMLNNYIRYSKIGGGQHGEVYLCHKVNTRYPVNHPERRLAVAMKSVKRENPRAEQFKRFRQQRLPTSPHTPLADRLNTTEAKIRKEIAIMKKCRHPHVVRLYEVIDDRMKDKIYMVMEYLDGGEVNWRNSNDEPILKVEQSRRIIRDAVLGLEYLHHQGIIHRDIKPANLLWTKDRSQVKIADFGVSHFSYAQRLAAAAKDGVSINDPDPILFDDSDLTRRAGTPSFLAPEIVYEHTNDVELESSASSSDNHEGSSSSQTATPQSLSTLTRKRPQITKAIDVWALGVTLYCLLFGKTPFVADPATPASEWSLYNSICNNDWTVDDTMGSDNISTGGRHSTADDTEGAIVIHLLDHFLEKDVRLRITLEEVKESPWFLRDLPEPEKWLKLTSPIKKIDVSVDEASDAMSTVHFRWNWGAVITRRISSLFRRTRDDDRDRDVDGPVRPEPNARIRRRKTSTTGLQAYEISDSSKNDKGKERATRPDSSTPYASKSLRSRSTEPRRIRRRDHGTSSLSALHASGHSGRRGSATGLVDPNPSVSSQSSPTTSDKSRTLFGFLFNPITHWRPNKYSSQVPSPTTTTATPSLTAGSTPQRVDSSVRSRVTRRSEEALRYRRYNPLDDDGALTADRRASSWGQGDQPVEFADVLNLQSIRKERSERAFVGASHSGVYNDQSFAPRTPSRLSNVAATSPPKKPAFEEEQQFGPAYFDEDSSTIASAYGNDSEWQNGSELEEEEDGGEDSDDQDEPAVTFMPRRR